MTQQQQPEIPANGQPTEFVQAVKPDPNFLSPERSAKEMAECRQSIAKIGELMKEIEHQVQRMQLFAPHVSSVTPVSDFVTRWSEFRNGNWVFRESVGI